MTRTTTPLNVSRWPEKHASDDRRVITRFARYGSEQRIQSILDRVLQLDPPKVQRLLDGVMADFASRHRDVKSEFMDNFQMVEPYIDPDEELTESKKLLVGAYFTSEYSIASAALFNPSIVAHPTQDGVGRGAVRFLLSLRATGEGHLSSIIFAGGVINDSGWITFDPPPRYAESAKPIPDKLYEKALFIRKLQEMGCDLEPAWGVLDNLGERFTFADMNRQIEALSSEHSRPQQFEQIADDMRWLAQANYDLHFSADCNPSEVVIFPATEHESHGMEDLRLVRFCDDNGCYRYYGTYTAYNGHRTWPMMLETEDFRHFHVTTLNGRYAMNKGMALFPRKVNGDYVMIARHDAENLFIMRSDDPHFWNESKLLQTPVEPWELVHIGNCGSPVETERGWILLTHGVGPVREYCIGAMLLDLDDPEKVIGRLREPLIAPTADEREGYVPNVVYSCGSMIHEDQLIIPYAMSDSATTLATVNVHDLVDRLLDEGP